MTLKTKFLAQCCAFLLLLTACKQEQQKTQSMLKLEQAYSQSQLLVDKANKLLSGKVMASPQLHLDSIVYAKKVSDDAIKVFDTAKIRDWAHPELNQVRNKIMALQPELSLYAIDLLVQTTEKTMVLRERIEEVKNIPYGGSGMSTDKMVEYLSKNYNADISDCCLVRVTRITEILLIRPNDYAELITLSRYIYPELEKVVSDEKSGKALLSKLAQLRNKLQKTKPAL